MSSSSPANEIRCMLIPLRSGRLLLPSAAVAEVIGYRDPDRMPGAAAWLQGNVDWHQRKILVIDFERMLGRPVSGAGIRQRIAVCYALNPGGSWPLMGLVAQGIPRLLHVSPEALESVQGGAGGDSPIRMTVSVAGEELLVPDLDYLQAQLPAA